jgi:hypothetical protein
MPDIISAATGVVNAIVGRIGEKRPITRYGLEIEGLLKNRGIAEKDARATGRKYEKRFDEIIGPLWKISNEAVNQGAVRAMAEVVNDVFGGEDVYGRGPHTSGLSSALWDSKKMDLRAYVPPKGLASTPPTAFKGPTAPPFVIGVEPPGGAAGGGRGAPIATMGAGDPLPAAILVSLGLLLFLGGLGKGK